MKIEDFDRFKDELTADMNHFNDYQDRHAEGMKFYWMAREIAANYIFRKSPKPPDLQAIMDQMTNPSFAPEVTHTYPNELASNEPMPRCLSGERPISERVNGNGGYDY